MNQNQPNQTKSLLLLCALLALAACSTAARPTAEVDIFIPSVVEDARPVERIYNVALDLLAEREYYRALAEFSVVESQYPYSIWARRALLRKSWLYYLLDNYDEAIISVQRFIQLYPADDAAPYANYLAAICLYEQIGDAVRSPEKARAARDALLAVEGLYPESLYARDAKVKASYVHANLAAREMRIGRYYLWRGSYVGAVRRFQNVVRDYGQTIYAPEALHRLAEVYLTLGLREEALRAGAIAGHNFPASIWYKRTYALLKAYPPEDAKTAAAASPAG